MGIVLTIFHLVIFVMVVLQPGRLPVRPDSGIFQYAGWYMAQGGTLYTEIWEVKLPLAYEIPALLALLSGGNILVHHLLNVMITIIAAVGSGLLVSLLVHDLTNDRGAALISGVSVLLLPGFFYLPAYGFKAKFFVTITALLSIYSARTERPMLSGGAAAACVGFYQAAAIVPILAVVLSYQHDKVRGAARAVAGGVVLTAIMVAPIVLSGATSAMITEAILTLFIIDTGHVSLIDALVSGGRYFGVAAPAVLLGGIGILFSISDYNWRDTWWITVAAVWFGFIVFFVDYDSYPDLIPGLVIVAIGVGIIYDKFSWKHGRAVIAGVVSICIVVNLILVLSGGVIAGIPSIKSPQPLDDLQQRTYQKFGEDGEKAQIQRPTVQYLYWNQIESNTCHIRLSGTEIRWLHMTNKPWIDKNCGDLQTATEHIG